MKRKYFFGLIILALIIPVAGFTQAKVTVVESLAIDIWPDYDRASVLVLLTGTLPAGTKLPATVTLPLPETARLNAVARIDSSDGKMKDDIFSSTAAGEITFTIPDSRFRLEYYLPYTVNIYQRTFDFTWLADVSVNRFQLKVQQPLSASSLTTDPGATNVFRGEDGLTYYDFPAQAVPAGESFSIHVDYTMTAAQLSVESLAPPSTPVQEPGSSPPPNTKVRTNWSIIAVVMGILIMLIVFIWQIITSRAASDRPITQDAEDQKHSRAKFCHHCGNPIDKEDRFCGKCGAAVQGG